MTTATKVSLKPLSNRVLLKRLDEEKVAKGGIILPDSAKKKQERACVIAVGPGKEDKNGKYIPVEVKVNDIVLIEKYSGQEVTLNDEEYTCVRSDEIIAIVQ